MPATKKQKRIALGPKRSDGLGLSNGEILRDITGNLQDRVRLEAESLERGTAEEAAARRKVIAEFFVSRHVGALRLDLRELSKNANVAAQAPTATMSSAAVEQRALLLTLSDLFWAAALATRSASFRKALHASIVDLKRSIDATTASIFDWPEHALQQRHEPFVRHLEGVAEEWWARSLVGARSASDPAMVMAMVMAERLAEELFTDAAAMVGLSFNATIDKTKSQIAAALEGYLQKYLTEDDATFSATKAVELALAAVGFKRDKLRTLVGKDAQRKRANRSTAQRLTKAKKDSDADQ